MDHGPQAQPGRKLAQFVGTVTTSGAVRSTADAAETPRYVVAAFPGLQLMAACEATFHLNAAEDPP